MLARWLDTDEPKREPYFSSLKVFDIIGYGRTANSPVEMKPMKYLKHKDKKIMNRNSLLEVSKRILNNNREFKSRAKTKFKLPRKEVLIEMSKIIKKLYNEKNIRDYCVIVARELAHILSGETPQVTKLYQKIVF